MNTSLSLRIARAALLGSALLLGACMTGNEEEVARGTVDARTAGQSLAGSFAAAGDWDAKTGAPAAQGLGAFSTKPNPLKKSTALPKRATGVEGGFKIIFDDTGKGIVTLTSSSNILGIVTEDTVVAKWDDKAKDDIDSNENIVSLKHVVTNSFTMRVESIEIVDADGDGIVTIVPGGANKGKLTFTTVDNGVTEKAVLVAAAGPDENWDLENDNVVYSAVWTRSKGGVVTAEARYEDGDADGIVADNAKTNVVKATFWELEPKDKPWVAKAEAEIIVRVFPKAQGGDEPVSFSFTETLKTGRVNVATLKNREGKSEIVKNDTLWVKFETTKTSGDDTLKHAEIVFVMNPGNDLKSESDDVLYAIHVKTEKKKGFERSAEFHFISDAPIPHGQEPTSGSFSGHATYADGKSASLEGTFTPSSFKATYTGPDGSVVTVEYSKNGEVVTGI